MTKLRDWWHDQAEDESALSGDTPAWLISLVIHVVLLVALAVTGWRYQPEKTSLVMESPPPDEVEQPLETPVALPQEFAYSDIPQEQVGAQSENGPEMAESLAPTVSDVSEIPIPEPSELVEVSVLKIEEFRDIEATGLKKSNNILSKGATGVGTTGAMGAIDRITYEIMRSLEERRTLVVWLFDSTVSLSQQRKQIHDRFDRIYHELGVIESAGNPSFTRHSDKPLLTSVVAFGKEVIPMIKTPTDNLTEIKLAVSGMKIDRSGEERVFTAVGMTADAMKKYAVQEQRNVMLIVFTDEVGSDENRADDAIQICRKFKMPVYVVGVPAPFGQRDSQMKWVDPDPAFDQTAQWGRVDQGPETRFPEVIKLLFSGQGAPDDPVDSGYGPYSLTRMTYETGGIYFSVHPNRDSRQVVTRQQTSNLSAHLARFFDAEVMQRYKPDYKSDEEYKRMLAANKAQTALLQAAAQPNWIAPMGGPHLHFPKRDDGELVRLLNEAQKAAARLEPQINALYAILKTGETDRSKLENPRWQAGYDLAMGRVLAVKVRTEAYNAMLAQAKSMKFKDPKNDTWDLVPSDKVTASSILEKEAAKAKDYLTRVVAEHAGTPWSHMAQRELQTPLGWEWKERYTGVNRPKMTPGNGNAPAPADDKLKTIPKPPPRRPVPPL